MFGDKKERIADAKRDFALNEAIENAIEAGLVRGGKVFTPGASDEPLRLSILTYFGRLFGRVLEQKYSHPVSASEHVGQIGSFRRVVNTTDVAPTLLGGELSFGRAQKIFNLYVKHLWTLGVIVDVPPQCPVDDIVISALKKFSAPQISWTSPKFTREVYDEVMAAAQQAADQAKMSIAEWEVLLWEDERRSRAIEMRKRNTVKRPVQIGQRVSR